MNRRYIPKTGDIVWLHLNPQAGHEQAGHRPAVVLSPREYNRKTGLLLCCPLTTQIKGYPFEVANSTNPPSAALADQVKSLDWKARKARHKGQVSRRILVEIRAKIFALISAED